MTPLETEIKDRIFREGPVSFCEVMRAALYQPEHGYYANLRGFGAEGDFITSPEEHPAFGWILGRQALDVWKALGRPSPFRILELGGGSGALAESLVGFLRAHVQEIVYTLEEISPSLEKVQRTRLTGTEFQWSNAHRNGQHFILANEVADALPVHRAIVHRGRFHELLVGVDESERLVFVEDPTPNTEIEKYFQTFDYSTPPDGSIVDVSLDLPGWVRTVTSRLGRGVSLILDYGASPPRDSLLTYVRHTMGSNPLVGLGQQDISAHVDLGTLVRVARAEGLETTTLTQRELLFNLGFRQVYGTLPGQTDRDALEHLVDSKGLGGQITAVFLLQGMSSGYLPAGLTAREWPRPDGVPRLEPDHAEAEFVSMWREAFANADADPEEVAEA